MSDIGDVRRRALQRHLERVLRGEVRFDAASRKLYSTDASIYQIEPAGVVLPHDTEDLQQAVCVARDHRMPLVPRGGGTSLSGQSIGAGLIVDQSKYLNRILDLNLTARSVTVQPGVLLDQLNRVLAPHGYQFGPEVATASRATLGGMIGNNSAGSRSIVYGKTLDHVKRLRVVLADGSALSCEPITHAEWDRRAAWATPEGGLYRGVREIVRSLGGEIRRRFPRLMRRVSGYNLDALATLADPEAAGRISLGSLVVGSEGTLAAVVEADLHIVPRPRFRGLLVPHFDSLASAMQALAPCLEFQPSAVELIDQLILDLARENLSLRRQMALVRGRPAALFMVEISSDDPKEATDRLDRLQRRLGEVTGVTAVVRATAPEEREPLWNLRSAGLPLLLGMPGNRKPVTFVEDTAVAPEHLPEFVARFRELLRRHGTDGAFYGHASVGCLHIRPVLNLKDAGDVAKMRAITEEVTDLVLGYGGALSGEHGDGLARSEWNRKMFGDLVYEGFRQVKRLFDPANLMNPGKVVDAPAMTENLRYGAEYHPHAPPTVMDYSGQGGFLGAIEMCNGSGVCRRMEGGTMCPSFRATRDEADSTRGRANALRLALAGIQPLEDLASPWLYQVMDLCLMCKACKAECPSNVDLAKLKAEFLHQYYQRHLRPIGQRMMARIDRLNPVAAAIAPLANWLGQNRFWRWLMERFGGIDRRRSLPPLAWRHFRRWFRRRLPPISAGSAGRVLLLDDCFTTYNEPHIGQAAVTVLERAGFRVELAGLRCCGRALISKGFLAEARVLVADQAGSLADRLTNGVPLLGIEPSCLLTLVDEWPALLPTPATQRIAAVAHLADGWLAAAVRNARCSLALKPQPVDCVVHGHCHQKALVGMEGTVDALRLVPGLSVTVLNTGCCGMAGSFGYEKEHFDLSMRIAALSIRPELDSHPEAMVVAPGTSCRHQIKDLNGRAARHPLEVLADSLE